MTNRHLDSTDQETRAWEGGLDAHRVRKPKESEGDRWSHAARVTSRAKRAAKAQGKALMLRQMGSRSGTGDLTVAQNKI